MQSRAHGLGTDTAWRDERHDHGDLLRQHKDQGQAEEIQGNDQQQRQEYPEGKQP